MLPRSRRIRRAEEFRSIVRRGRHASTSTVVVHVGPLDAPGAASEPASAVPARGPARAGFVVGRSVARSAVVRNRVLRRLRDIVATQLPRLPDGTGVIVRALPAAADATFDALSADVSAALGRCVRSMGRVPAPEPVVSL